MTSTGAKTSGSTLVWFITGASRGFGLEIARQALERGDAVVATARDPRGVEKNLPGAGASLLAVALDVTDEQEAQSAVARGVERFGRIDVLVNNAGRGLLGAVEEASPAEVRAVFTCPSGKVETYSGDDFRASEACGHIPIAGVAYACTPGVCQ